MRMRNGIFSVDFESNLGWQGVGLAVMHNGHIRGGDDEYLYFGEYAIEEGRYVSTVAVRRHRGQTGSIFGPFEAFDLDFAGSHSDSSFKATGVLRIAPDLTMSVQGHLIRDFGGNHAGQPATGASAPFRYLDSRKWGSLGAEMPLGMLDNSMSLLGEDGLRQVRLAKTIFEGGDYASALALVCPMIETAVNRMVERAGLRVDQFEGLSAKTRLLHNHGSLPADIWQAGEVFKTRNLACHGAIPGLPTECVYPLCLLAFLYLDRLITEYRPRS